MTPLQQAKAALDTACEDFNEAANAETPPDKLERAVRSLMVAVDEYAEIRRSGVLA